MSLSYFNVKKLRRQSRQQDSIKTPISPGVATVTSPSEEPTASPVLDEADQKFLERLTAISQEPEGVPPPLPIRPVVILNNGEVKTGRDAQEALMDGAENVPLPMSPLEVVVDNESKDKTVDRGKKGVMSYFALAQGKFKRSMDKSKEDKKDKKERFSDKDREKAANTLLAAAESSKSSEEKKEEQELTIILDQLNLSAVNNRAFSFSKESEELLSKFTLVLKDIVNGVPTAYNDLEKLFTDYDKQLKKMYGSLPPFLQNMVKSLPAKITATLGPEIMAAQADKPGFDAKLRASASGIKSASKKARIPSLKSLVSAEGAVATMLRSIFNFLKLRFPMAVTGTNVLMSLAVFLLLFVFWYCHKRGRETRLEKEAKRAEGEQETAFDSSASFTDDSDSIFEKNTEEGNKKAEKEKAQYPPIIHDNKDATVDDMPSVSHLPDPISVQLTDIPAKEGISKFSKQE